MFAALQYDNIMLELSFISQNIKCGTINDAISDFTPLSPPVIDKQCRYGIPHVMRARLFTASSSSSRSNTNPSSTEPVVAVTHQLSSIVSIESRHHGRHNRCDCVGEVEATLKQCCIRTSAKSRAQFTSHIDGRYVKSDLDPTQVGAD